MIKAEISLLMDIYGKLLTEKQRAYLDLYYNNDLSLQEIAEYEGISRQGVHDMIRRGESTLHEFEAKLGFMARLNRLESELEAIEKNLLSIAGKCGSPCSADSTKNIENEYKGDNIDAGEGENRIFENNMANITMDELNEAIIALAGEVRQIINTIMGG